LKIVIAIVVGLIFVVYLGFDPLRKSESNLRIYVLQYTPIGSRIEEVQKTIESKRWTVTNANNDSGFLHQGKNPFVEVGDRFIRASLGDYRGFPFEVNVTVFWGFTEAGELLDIWVWKTSNGL